MVYANRTKKKLNVKYAGKSYRLKPGEHITFYELDFDTDDNEEVLALIHSKQLVPVSDYVDLQDFSFNDLDIKPQIDLIDSIEHQFTNIQLKQTTD